MDTSQLDRLTRGLARLLGRRRGLQGLLALGAVPLGITFLGSADDAEAGKTCKRDCGECQQCKKGKCRKTNHGKKRCKKSKCKAETNGTTCNGGTCQEGTCQPTPPPCGNACTGDETCVSEVCCLPETVDLQEAVYSASAGDTLRLCPGTWNLTNAVTIDRDLTLIGAGASATRLDGENVTRVLRIYAVAVTLQDLTIRNGNTVNLDHGGGIFSDGDITLLRVSVTGNTATQGGGGIFTGGTVSLAAGSSVTGNTAPEGGGILNANSGTVTLQAGSSMTGNTATTGGGVHNGNGTLILQAGSIVTGNTATSGGGVYNPSGTVTLDSGAIVCSNIPLNNQCFGTVSGTCPAPSETCPS